LGTTRPSWVKAFRKENLQLREGEYWEMALKKFPKLVLPYLSRTKEMAKKVRFKNVLFAWPRIVREYKKRRKKGNALSSGN
jgi:hypothetical protein